MNKKVKLLTLPDVLSLYGINLLSPKSLRLKLSTKKPPYKGDFIIKFISIKPY